MSLSTRSIRFSLLAAATVAALSAVAAPAIAGHAEVRGLRTGGHDGCRGHIQEIPAFHARLSFDALDMEGC